jgi:uncharacterized protein (TIGR02145 family)
VTCEGCTDIEADNYNPDATYDDGSCLFIGCMDNTACNYSPEATEDDGSCDYSCCPGPGCCDVGTYWNEETQTCIITNLTDTNLDGCTDLNDLMDILANYGDCAVSGFTCGNPLGYQGYDYETVLIGEQCWFSENCRYIPSVSPSSEGSDTEPYYYVYDYQGNNVGEAIATDNYETYGVLYNWPAVITDEICPSDWHVPSDGEFTQLTDFLGGANVAGDAMKSTTDWYNGGNGSNSSGFNGLPSGLAYSGSFSNDGYSADWWSSSSYFSSSARLLHLCYCNDIGHPSFDPRSYGFSARCLRD